VSTVHSFCRTCGNGCAVLLDVDGDRVTRLAGDPDNPVYRGYSCVKGRATPGMQRSPDRLLHPLRRTAAASFEPSTTATVVDEIADRLQAIIERDGPGAVAMYWGTSVLASAVIPAVSGAFMRAIGSPLLFTTNTIDKGGRQTAAALHGMWMAPRQAWDEPDVALLLGVNPFISYQGFPLGHPGKWLAENKARGMKLIVVDPRRSDVAKRADLHLQARPGTDVWLLGAFLRVILDEKCYDHEFVIEHTTGIDALRSAVDRFTPTAVAEVADVDAVDIVEAARLFASARRGFATAGTGAHMTGHGTLTEYLLLCLESLCGHYLRAGEKVRSPGTLVPTFPHKAQAAPPRAATGLGHSFRVRDLTMSVAGPPTAALPDEILLEGPGRIRALVCVNGNPAAAIPGKNLTVRALRDLELLVTIDPWMSETSQLADYVIAPTHWLEVPGTTLVSDVITMMAPMYGLADAYAQYAPAVVPPPDGADVIEEWAFFYRLAQRMGLKLQIDGVMWFPSASTWLDMEHEPTTDELLELTTAGSRVPLAEVMRHPGGAMFAEPPVVVEPADLGWEGRLDLANSQMLADLGALERDNPDNGEFPWRLVSRRVQHVHNSSYNCEATHRGRPYNPAFLHPHDLRELGVTAGALVEIRSQHGEIVAVAESDDTVRRGVVSMTHCFGEVDVEAERAAPRRRGSSTNWLTSNCDVYDRYTGQPRMSNVPVAVRALVS